MRFQVDEHSLFISISEKELKLIKCVLKEIALHSCLRMWAHKLMPIDMFE